ncbi:hypothetical protein L917_11976 [Phytophthora nicotianae]|uniref:Uncharacterized protein n=1 Tax=Phytophthora nicotianae TaxID=4792 RepID=W2KWP4_PHYNI|nr:hypothetical protein L917_11976 [Phytophthora nicotianae]ETM42259.1 hypothetical protein L914_12057 [Phytophthora nicotianae]
MQLVLFKSGDELLDDFRILAKIDGFTGDPPFSSQM